MFDPFLIPLYIELDAISVLDDWGDGKKDRVELTINWSKVLSKHVCTWQRGTFDWCTNDNDLTSIEMINKLLNSSCDTNLVRYVNENFDQLFENREGSLI